MYASGVIRAFRPTQNMNVRYSRAMNEFEKRLRSINWSQYDGPEYYCSKELITALSALSNLAGPDHHGTVYDRVLSAVGSNHAGTYYPAIMEAMSFLSELATSELNEHASCVAKEILTDLQGSFYAELGNYCGHTAAEIESFVQNYNVSN